MSDFRRRTFIAKKPYDAEVEWLQASGGAYIDTGIKTSSSIQIKTKLYNYFDDTSLGGKWPFGGRDGANIKAFGMFMNGITYKLWYTFGSNSYELDLYDQFPKGEVDVEMKKGCLKVGNKTYQTINTTFAASTTQNVFIFCLNNGGAPTNGDGIKLGATTITDGTKTLDLIPVRVGQVGYMYDKVSHQLFGNSGTGSFILGPDL